MSEPLKVGAWGIPANWTWIDVASVADTTSGGTPRRDRPEYYGGRIPWLKSGELRDRTVFEVEEYITEEGLRNSSAKVFPPGTLCIALYGATVGKLAILGVGSSTNQAICGIFPAAGVDARFLFRFFELIRPQLIELGKGGAQPNISQGIVRGTFFPLSPANEQQRIVAEIDKQFTRLDAAVAALKRVQGNLKRYRAAVLKAACEGRLVPTEADLARKEGRSYETGDQLLARILKERQAKWQADQLAKMVAAGRPPKDEEWKKKYQEPPSLDSASLPILPVGWKWAQLDALAEIKGGITKGQQRRATDVLRSIPYLRVANVQRGYLDLEEMKEIEATEDEIAELRLQEGDVLFNEGGDRDKLGRGWIWGGQIPVCIHQNHVFRARLYSPNLQPKFLSWYSNSFGQSYFFGEGKQTTNLASVNMTKLKALPVPIPPAAEQARIVQEVERHLSEIDGTLTAVRLSQTRAERLRQSILKRAFEGKLVPQDLNDEPATTLLERIRAERAAHGGNDNGRRSRKAVKSSVAVGAK